MSATGSSTRAFARAVRQERRLWASAAVAVAVVCVAGWLAFGCDWRNGCEKVGLVQRCVAVGIHEEIVQQLVSIDNNGIPSFMPVSQTVTDYACSCEPKAGAR